MDRSRDYLRSEPDYLRSEKAEAISMGVSPLPGLSPLLQSCVPQDQACRKPLGGVCRVREGEGAVCLTLHGE